MNIKEKILNKFKAGENKLEFSKNQKGIITWNFTLYCRDVFDGVMISDKIIDVIEIMIKDKEKKEE